jgi:hypothetical protein
VLLFHVGAAELPDTETPNAATSNTKIAARIANSFPLCGLSR